MDDITGHPPATGQQPTIGLIVPPAGRTVPPGGGRLYPAVRFDAVGLGLAEVEATDFDRVVDDVEDCAMQLAARGVSAISLMGTSLSFYRGREFNDTLRKQITTASGLPASTMSTAILRALTTVGARRVAVATAYTDDVTDRLCAFLDTAGLAVTATVSMGLGRVTDILATGDTEIERVAANALSTGRGADSLLISCGGLDTTDLLDRLEQRLGVPVVASSPAGFWDVVQLVGVDPRVEGHGLLFTRTAPEAAIR